MKRKMMQVVTICLLGVFIFQSTVLASESVRYGLEQVISKVLGENLELQMAKIDWENSQLEYEKSKANNLLNQSRSIELEAEYNLLNGERGFKQMQNNIITSTFQLYSDIILSRLNLQLKEKSLSLEELLLAEMKKQVEMGDKGNLDLLQQKNGYNNARFNVEKAEDVYQQHIKELYLALNYSPESVVLQELPEPRIAKIDEEINILTALENSIELELKEKRVQIAKVNLERVEGVSTSELDLKIITNKLKRAQLEQQLAKDELAQSIRKQSNDLKQAITRLELAKENRSTAVENYRVIKEQKAAGLKTAKDLLQAEIKVLEQDYQYFSAIFEYYLKELALQQAMGLENGVWNNETTER